MRDFGIFIAEFGKTMGNMGDFQQFSPYFFNIFNCQNVISKKKVVEIPCKPYAR